MASFACKDLQVLNSDGIITLTLNRPQVCNAFNADLISELTEFSRWMREAPQRDVRAVFMRGAGKLFCSGGDLNWMKDSLAWNTQENYVDSEKLSAMFTALNELEKPLIGLVHGGAYGGGVGLVSVCDHVICEEKTVFSLSEVKLGLIPACIGPFVLDKVGMSQARSLFISGERFSAAKAKDIGLIHEVVACADDLDVRQAAMVKTFLTCGPHAIQTAKRFLREIKFSGFPEANRLAAKTLADLRVGPEAQEGIRAFLEKRSPRW